MTPQEIRMVAVLALRKIEQNPLCAYGSRKGIVAGAVRPAKSIPWIVTFRRVEERVRMELWSLSARTCKVEYFVLPADLEGRASDMLHALPDERPSYCRT